MDITIYNCQNWWLSQKGRGAGLWVKLSHRVLFYIKNIFFSSFNAPNYSLPREVWLSTKTCFGGKFVPGGGVIFPRVTLTFLTLKNPFLTADNG